jgi:predicted esterase
VSENGLARYFRRLAEGVFDIEDLHARTDDLARFVAEASVVYGFDRRLVLAVGFSNGANIAASLLLSEPRTLSGAVLLHPMVPFEPEVIPDLTGVPVFVGAGRNDPMAPVPLTERLIELLTAGGATVTTNWQPGGHRLTRDEVTAAITWAQQGDKPWN